MAKRMFDNLIPYTNVHEMNLDWIIEKVEEYIKKYIDLETFVNATITEQNEIIENAVKELENGLEELTNYIRDNLRVIANEIINELIESGELYIGTEYVSETEELNIILSRGE